MQPAAMGAGLYLCTWPDGRGHGEAAVGHCAMVFWWA